MNTKWIAITISIGSLLFLTACNLDPGALLGNQAPRDNAHLEDYNKLPVVEPQQVCYAAQMQLKQSTDAAGCETPKNLGGLVKRLDTDKDGHTIIFDLLPISSGIFAKINKVVYKKGTNEKLELRTLKCKHMTPVDDLNTRRVFECTLVRTAVDHATKDEYVLHSVELQNEKCEAKAIFESVFESPDCAPTYVNSMSLKLNGQSVPSLKEVEDKGNSRVDELGERMVNSSAYED